MSKEEFIDYYVVMGLPIDASMREIRSAYLQRAKLHHPDVGGEQSEMEVLNTAYQVLRNDRSRKAYDMLHQVQTGRATLEYRISTQGSRGRDSLAGMSDEEIDNFVNEAFAVVTAQKQRQPLRAKAKRAFKNRKWS